MSEEKPLHIIALEAQNVKRLKAVRIRPDGSLVVIGGRNAAGKSSLLDSVEMALGGAKTIPADPVRHGARKARIVADLGEIVVERTFTPKGSHLSVKDKDGNALASPQGILDKLCAAKVAFDPLAFTRMRPDEQDKILKELLGLDFSEIDAARKRLYDERTGHNREAKKLSAQLDAMPEIDADVPDAESSVADLLAELEAQQEIHQQNEAHREDLRNARAQVADAKGELSELDGEIKALEERLAAKQKERILLTDRIAVEERGVSDLELKVSKLVDPDVSELKRQIQTAEQTNARVREKQRARELERQAEAERAAAEQCTAALQSLDEEKAEKLAQAEFPIEGLGFDDTGPTLNDVPLEQASQAEKLRLSIAIGAALNPRVRVVLVREGSLLDEDALRLLAEYAQEHDLQVFLERVSTTGEGCSVLIEDGEIVEPAESAAE